MRNQVNHKGLRVKEDSSDSEGARENLMAPTTRLGAHSGKRIMGCNRRQSYGRKE
jgi:hypothetical protein